MVPGALFAVAAIIGVSVGLSWFVSQSVLQVRWLTYGAIGTVIVLLFWAFLVGSDGAGGRRDQRGRAPGGLWPDDERREASGRITGR